MPAEAVVYVPGMMCDARLWAPQTAALPQQAVHADITRADSIAEIAGQILDAAPPRFALAGLSMGGIVAFEIWRQAPERVTHMALFDTNARPDAPEKKSMRFQQVQTALAGGLRELAIESLKPMYLAESHRDDEALLGTVLDMALDLGPAVFERQSAALRDRVDSVPTLRTIDCPVLVACGVEDKLCPPGFHELMAAEIPDATLRIIDDCGHLASLEQPDIVNRELETLFAR